MPGTSPHDDIIIWKHFPRYWPFVRGIHWSPMASPHKGQWCWALMFSLICTWTNSWANNWDAGDLKCPHAHYDVTVMHEVTFRWDINISSVNDLVPSGKPFESLSQPRSMKPYVVTRDQRVKLVNWNDNRWPRGQCYKKTVSASLQLPFKVTHQFCIS